MPLDKASLGADVFTRSHKPTNDTTEEEIMADHDIMTDHDIEHITEEYDAILTNTDAHGGPVVIMLSSGYAELWDDGEVTQHGHIVYRC